MVGIGDVGQEGERQSFLLPGEAGASKERLMGGRLHVTDSQCGPGSRETQRGQV